MDFKVFNMLTFHFFPVVWPLELEIQHLRCPNRILRKKLRYSLKFQLLKNSPARVLSRFRFLALQPALGT